MIAVIGCVCWVWLKYSFVLWFAIESDYHLSVYMCL